MWSAEESRQPARRGIRENTPNHFLGFLFVLRRSTSLGDAKTRGRPSFVFVCSVQRGTQLRHSHPLKAETLRRLPKKFATRVPRFSAGVQNPRGIDFPRNFQRTPWFQSPVCAVPETSLTSQGCTQ